jgi:hypothetical protein
LPRDDAHQSFILVIDHKQLTKLHVPKELMHLFNGVFLCHKVRSLDHVGSQIEHFLRVLASDLFDIFGRVSCALKILVELKPFNLLRILPGELFLILGVDVVLIIICFILVGVENFGVKGSFQR